MNVSSRVSAEVERGASSNTSSSPKTSPDSRISIEGLLFLDSLHTRNPLHLLHLRWSDAVEQTNMLEVAQLDLDEDLPGGPSCIGKALRR